jgi:hypothetical protein
MAVTETGTSTSVQRVGAILLLLVAGALSLPVSATFLDGEGTENWIVPVQLAAMALIGALVGATLPGLAGDGASRRRGAWIGAVVGIVMAVLGVAVFSLLINGLDGA